MHYGQHSFPSALFLPHYPLLPEKENIHPHSTASEVNSFDVKKGKAEDGRGVRSKAGWESGGGEGEEPLLTHFNWINTLIA
jgi:hypothetical protein